MEGPGKYEEEASAFMDLLEARGIALVVLDGKKGYGFEVVAGVSDRKKLILVFRSVADEMERELEQVAGVE